MPRESLYFRIGVDYILSLHWNIASIPQTHRHLVSEQHPFQKEYLGLA